MTDSDPTREMLNISRGTTLGRYEILERIGAGGMGEVFLARDSQLKRNVAVKFPPPHLSSNPAYTERLLREAQAAGGLDHAGIVHVYDVGDYQGRPYLVMEHVTGDPLDTTLRDGPLSPQAAVRMGRRLAEALDYAHRHGVLHRDIKPANVIIDIHGRPKLIDFGLAYSPDEAAAPGEGTTLGTVGYMAPEVIKGETSTAKSDLFSLGVLLYKSVTGKMPFPGDTQATVVDAVLKRDVKWPSDTSPLVPGELQKVISRLLEKNPGDRPESGAEVASVLRTMGGDTTEPHPQASERRWSRLLIPAVAVVAVVAAVAAFVMRDSGGSGGVVADAQAAAPKVIVLPFENLSGAERQGPMGEVMSSLIITGLSQSQSLSVIPNDYAHQLMKRTGGEGGAQAVAREVDARWLVTGKILQEAPTLIVSAELIDPEAGTVLNAQRVEGTTGETVFQVVDRLTARLLADLAVGDDAGSGSVADVTTHSAEAYASYMQGFLAATDFQFLDAKNYLTQAVTLDPEFALAWIGLANVEQTLGNRSDADSCLARAERYMTGLPRRDQLMVRTFAAQLREDPVLMLSALEELVALDPASPFPRFQKGIAHQLLGQMEEAIWEWERAVDIDPNFAPAYNQLAYRYEGVGNLDKSLWAINEYIRLSPGKPNPYDSRGDLYARAGKLELAVESYQKALEIDPTFFTSELNLGKIYAFLGKPARAERTFQSVIQDTETEHPNVATSARLHSALLPAHGGQFQSAILNLKELAATATEQQQGGILAILALLYNYVEQYEQAEETAREALACEFHSPEGKAPAQATLARALTMLGREEEAEEILDSMTQSGKARSWVLAGMDRHREAIAALEDEETDTPDYFNRFFLGQSRYFSGDFEGAVDAYAYLADRYAVERYFLPLDGLIHYYLGAAYHELGRTQEAREQLARFIAQWEAGDPDLRDLADARMRLNALEATP